MYGATIKMGIYRFLQILPHSILLR